MRVADFMKAEVVTVTPDTPVLVAARLMLERKISGLPVVDEAGRPVGIVTEHDLLRRVTAGEGESRPHWLERMIAPADLAGNGARLRKVAEVMTRDPVMVAEGTPLEEASRLIEERGFKRLPVVRDGKLVGIIARADLVRALTQVIRRASVAAERDAGLKSQLVELERQALLYRTRSRGG
jgi:CBS domain-containing protein